MPEAGRRDLEFLVWLKTTPFAQWVLMSAWANPILLCFHAVGMALVVGTCLMTNLRLLGYAKSLPISFFRKLFVLAWTGVAFNVGSGLILFSVDGNKYIGNWTFQLKIASIVAAGITTSVMWRALDTESSFGAASSVGARVRIAATLSAVFWLGAITAGRRIAYTMQPGPG
jgi:hypothetical protein